MSNISYAATDKIAIFPLTIDRPEGYNGRVLTEQNISTILSKLTCDEAFVLSDLISSPPTLEFIIKGHYFKLTDSELLNKGQLYVGVNFENKGQDFEQLKGRDEIVDSISKFKDVDFSTEALSSDDYDYVLPLLETINDNIQVPISSKYRFNGDVIRSISGGTV